MIFVRRVLLIFCLIGFSNLGNSQSYFRLIDSSSGAYSNSYDSEIIQDGYLNFGQLHHKKGEEVLKYVRWSDDAVDFEDHEFFLSINKAEFLPVWLPIDLSKNDTLDVFLEPDPNYISYKTNLHYNKCGEPIYRKYYPKPLRDWSDLPTEAQSKIKERLIKSMGQEFFEKLFISSIYEYDGTKMNKAEGRVLYQNGEKGYRICLSFKDEVAGVAQYSADFFANVKGEISEMPAYPAWSQWGVFGQKNKGLLAFEQIVRIVESDSTINFEKSSSEFEFYPRANTFAWVFKEITGKSEEGLQKSKSTYIDAVSGKLLGVIYDETLVFEHFY